MHQAEVLARRTDRDTGVRNDCWTFRGALLRRCQPTVLSGGMTVLISTLRNLIYQEK